MPEYYPTLKEVLDHLGEDCILVGSATRKPLDECKDYDFVINRSGIEKLMAFEYYLYQEDSEWWQYIPLESGKSKAVDFFHGLCNVSDPAKHADRITYGQAIALPLKIVMIEGSEVLSI